MSALKKKATIPRAFWPASPTEIVSLKPIRDPVSTKLTRQTVAEERYLRLTSGLHMCAHAHIPTHTR